MGRGVRCSGRRGEAAATGSNRRNRLGQSIRPSRGLSRWLTAILLSAAAAAASAQEMPDMSVDAADLERGRTLYAEHCAACHGAGLEGQPDWRRPGENGVLPAPPHDAGGHTWHHGDRTLFDYTRLGGQAALAAQGVAGVASGMPAFGDTLSDAQIRDVLAWIKSTWPAKMREVQSARSRAEGSR